VSCSVWLFKRRPRDFAHTQKGQHVHHSGRSYQLKLCRFVSWCPYVSSLGVPTSPQFALQASPCMETTVRPSQWQRAVRIWLHPNASLLLPAWFPPQSKHREGAPGWCVCVCVVCVMCLCAFVFTGCRHLAMHHGKAYHTQHAALKWRFTYDFMTCQGSGEPEEEEEAEEEAPYELPSNAYGGCLGLARTTHTLSVAVCTEVSLLNLLYMYQILTPVTKVASSGPFLIYVRSDYHCLCSHHLFFLFCCCTACEIFLNFYCFLCSAGEARCTHAVCANACALPILTTLAFTDFILACIIAVIAAHEKQVHAPRQCFFLFPFPSTHYSPSLFYTVIISAIIQHGRKQLCVHCANASALPAP